jgi:hypothetical protein
MHLVRRGALKKPNCVRTTSTPNLPNKADPTVRLPRLRTFASACSLNSAEYVCFVFNLPPLISSLRKFRGDNYCDAGGKASGVGARRFCREQGLAVSTFSLWRKKLSSPVREIKQPLAVTADAAFIASSLDGQLAPQVPAVAPLAADAPASRDRVTLSLAGVRIELSGVHAERIVRFVLGQLGGGRC